MVTPSPLAVSANPTDPCAALLLDEVMLQRLANELARGLYDPLDVLRQYGLTEELFNERIVNNPGFMTFYAEGRAIWHASSNAKERFAAKSGVVVEQWLAEANRLLHDPSNPMAAKVALAQMLVKTANFEPEKQVDAGPSNGVSVTINLSHARIHPQTVHIDKVIDGKAVEVAAEGLPAQVTSVAAPTAAPERKSVDTLAIFRDDQQHGVVQWGSNP